MPTSETMQRVQVPAMEKGLASVRAGGNLETGKLSDSGTMSLTYFSGFGSFLLVCFSRQQQRCCASSSSWWGWLAAHQPQAGMLGAIDSSSPWLCPGSVPAVLVLRLDAGSAAGGSRCCWRGAGLRRVLPSTSQRRRPRSSSATGKARIPLLLPSLSLFCLFAQKLGLIHRTPAHLRSPKTLPPMFLLGRKQYDSNSPKSNVLHHAQPAETFT